MIEFGSRMLDELRPDDHDDAIFDERESAVASYCRAFPATFGGAKGSYLYDESGRAYLDFLSGAGALNYGHNHDEIKAAILEYVAGDGLAHGLDLHTVAKRNFLEQFSARILEPRGLDHRVQFTGPTGTNAVEAAFKVARKATGRPGIFAFMGGYHGHSLGSLAATANRAHRAGAGVAMPGVTHMPFPFGPMAEIDTLAYLRAVLTDTHSGVDTPAAIVVETVQAEGGVIVAPTPWLQGLRSICDDFGILLIVDEVQTGCGRTGPFFSFERAGIVPDLVCVSKSISGYGLPMALTLIRPAIDVLSPGQHTGTFRGNQLAFVAATSALSLFEKEGLEHRTHENGIRIATQLRYDTAQIDDRIDIRGIGMIWGVDTVRIDPTGALAGVIADRCFDEGLVIERVGRNDTALKILPPLTIDPLDLRAGLTTLAGALRGAIRS